MEYTIQITLADAIYHKLALIAQQTGQPIELVATRYIEAQTEQPNDPLVALIGSIDSGGIDWADKHDEYLGREQLNKNALN